MRRGIARFLTAHSLPNAKVTLRELCQFHVCKALWFTVSNTDEAILSSILAESFIKLLKREQVRRRIYPNRDAARQDVLECIEPFCNPKRKHTNNGMLAPVDFEIDSGN